MSSSVSHSAAYLLHYTLYRDTSFIVDVFSLECGRVTLLARGARSAKATSRALYQPFRPLLISWTGNRELRVLTGIEDSGALLEMDSQPLACAYYCNELLLRLLGKEQPAPELFAHYAFALARLAESSSIEATLRRFETQLLDALGLLPDFSRCTVDGSAIDPDQLYLFYPTNAIAIVDKQGTGQDAAGLSELPASAAWHPDGVSRENGIAIPGSALLAMAAVEFDDKRVLRQIKPLMRQLLRIHLGAKPLHSRNLFNSIVPPKPIRTTADPNL